MKLIFSVDLEDWRLSYNFDGKLSLKENEYHDSVLYSNVNYILNLLKEKKVSFFILGKFAERYPDIVKRISELGHDTGSHGYHHKNITDMTIKEFNYDIERSSEVIAKASGIWPIYYRSPNFSLKREMEEYYKVLLKHRIIYDSSCFPGRNTSKDSSGITQLNGVTVLPVSSYKGIPCGGGAYFRFFPYKIFNILISQSGKQDNYRMFYIHPWEIENTMPKQNLSAFQRFRVYHNVKKVKERLECIFEDFEICSISQFLNYRSAYEQVGSN